MHTTPATPSLHPAPPTAMALGLELRDHVALTRWIANTRKYVSVIREQSPETAADFQAQSDLVERALLDPLALTSEERSTLQNLQLRVCLDVCIEVSIEAGAERTARLWAEEALAFDELLALKAPSASTTSFSTGGQ